MSLRLPLHISVLIKVIHKDAFRLPADADTAVAMLRAVENLSLAK